MSGSDDRVDAYIEARPAAARRRLQQLRRIIRKAVPDAEETISYKIPAYKFGGRVLLYFAGWDEHYALYPASRGVFTAFASELAAFELGKGTIRFPLTKPVPATLIERIVAFRVAEANERRGSRSEGRRSRA